MMAEKHTPGPWTCSEKPNGPWWQIAAGNQSICTAHATDKKNTQVYAGMFHANAQLIAAAPDLLEALDQLVQYVVDCAKGDHLEGAIRTAERAITKATGATIARHNAELCGGPSGPSERAPG